MSITLRSFQLDDTAACGSLIAKTFGKFNSTGESPAAVQRYVDFYDPTKNDLRVIQANFMKSPIFLVAETDKQVVGLIRGVSHRINNLFVDGGYQHQGIGTRLMQAFEEEAKKQGSTYIKVKASPAAVKFYQKLGYQKTTGIRQFKGLRIQPMKKPIDPL